MGQLLPSPHPGTPLPARDGCVQGVLSRPTDRFAPSRGVHSPCPRSPALPQIPVKIIVVLTEHSWLEVLPKNLMENCMLPAWNSLPGANAMYI